ncbi:MAG TPA: Clp1/GlmU family protein [Candidatus Binatus sp.]|nr:Clp1/GlmU family protein [Candidatus Binatus sp.]
MSSRPIGKMLPVINLPSGRTLLLDGPASIRLIEGEAYCFGGILVKNRWILVKEERRLPFETEAGGVFEVELGSGGSVKETNGSTIPGSWIEAGQIVLQTLGTIVVLGDVDSGKSSLSTYLANISQSKGSSVNVIDADIGQADIGPPTTIGAAQVHGIINSLQDLDIEAGFFVGDTSPSLVPDKIPQGAVMVRSHLPSSDVLIVNTDGWIEGPEGFQYKLTLLEKLKPDIILGLGDHEQLDSLLNVQKGSTILKLGQSSYARSRSREERKRAREAGYKRFLQGTERIELKLDQLVVRYFDSPKPIKLSTNDQIRGVLAGLISDDGMLQGIARLLSLRAGRLSLETKSRGSVPRVLELGTVQLSPDYEESGYLHVGLGH